MRQGDVTTVAAALASTGGGAAPTVALGPIVQEAVLLPAGTASYDAAESGETIFVVAGAGRVRVAGVEHLLAPETGLYLGGGERVELEVAEPLRLVRARGPAGEPTTERAVGYADEAARDAGIGREFRLLACSSATTQFVGVVPPGRANMHNHPYDEVAYIVEGEGILHWHEGPSVPVAAGSCISFPRLVFHSLENTGGGDLRIMGVITPAHSPADRVEVLDA